MTEPEITAGSKGSVVVEPKVDIRSSGLVSAGGKGRRFPGRLGYGPKDRIRVIRRNRLSEAKIKVSAGTHINVSSRVTGSRETVGSS